MKYLTLVDMFKYYRTVELVQRASLDDVIDPDDVKMFINNRSIAPHEVEAVFQRIELSITDAEAEVDSYIGKRYSLPLNEINSLKLKFPTSVLARWKLFTEGTPPGLKDSVDGVRLWLHKISTGELNLIPRETSLGSSQVPVYRI